MKQITTIEVSIIRKLKRKYKNTFNRLFFILMTPHEYSLQFIREERKEGSEHEITIHILMPPATV